MGLAADSKKVGRTENLEDFSKHFPKWLATCPKVDYAEYGVTVNTLGRLLALFLAVVLSLTAQANPLHKLFDDGFKTDSIGHLKKGLNLAYVYGDYNWKLLYPAGGLRSGDFHLPNCAARTVD